MRRLLHLERRELLGAARVALLATALIAVAYAGLVALADHVVSDRLTGQVDRQLEVRLAAAASNEEKAFSTPGVQTNGARYGLGIYGEPIGLWAFSSSGDLLRAGRGDPLLPAATRPPSDGAARSFDMKIEDTTYRVRWSRAKGGWLLAAESLVELGHVEAVLLTAELVVFPFLLAVFFLVALLIGLRSARPVELARRRQLEFTADASHELRTPLSVVEAEVSLALSLKRPADQYEASLGRVAEEAKRLRRIVEDLLWLARVDSEPSEPASRPVDLAQVAREAADRFSPLAASRSQELSVGVEDPTGAGLVLSAPPEWLDKLAGTLVDNACRYCGEGATIRLLAARTESPRRLLLGVEDDGPGIPAERRREVSLRFKRGTTGGGGHGLGLAIADSVARATGGELAIEESSLGGALVKVSWPLGRQAAREP